MKHLTTSQARRALFRFLCLLAFCGCLLAGCDISVVQSGTSGTVGSNTCSGGQCVIGSGASSVSVIVEPDSGVVPFVDAIHGAQHSVWMEMYLLTSKDIINALEDDANRGIDVRVMLEKHPYGGGSVSPQETLAQLASAGIKAQFTNPSFALTHEKGLIIDAKTAYIMTSNFTNAALGTSKSTKNREYDVVDKNPQDVKAVAAIFQADWDRVTAQYDAPNLVVSPLNSRNTFNSLIASAQHTLLVTAEEMQDSSIEQDLVDAAQRGVKIQVILPKPGKSEKDSNAPGITTIEKGGVSVREDSHLYMHAKIFVVDGKHAFVGSENISSQSLDKNRELGIILADANAIQILEDTFQKDWSASQTAWGLIEP